LLRRRRHDAYGDGASLSELYVDLLNKCKTLVSSFESPRRWTQYTVSLDAYIVSLMTGQRKLEDGMTPALRSLDAVRTWRSLQTRRLEERRVRKMFSSILDLTGIGVGVQILMYRETENKDRLVSCSMVAG